MSLCLKTSLSWNEVARVAGGEKLTLSGAAWQRVAQGRALIQVILERGTRAYGVNTGVGALSEVVIAPQAQRALSRQLLFSHAAGCGLPLAKDVVRAIMAAQVNNLAHGRSGIRREILDLLLALLQTDHIPVVPSQGSIGYLVHLAYIGLVLIGEGRVDLHGQTLPGATALAALGLAPVVLEAKEGLSLINGTACATGMACVALARLTRLLDMADVAAALSFASLGARVDAFDPQIIALRQSAGAQVTAQRLTALLRDDPLLPSRALSRVQDALSLRAVPHAHGAVRESLGMAEDVVNRELLAVTDNPILLGEPDAPRIASQAHAVAPLLATMLDLLAVSAAQLSAISERRLDRLVNPLVSGLPPFLAPEAGTYSGYMIAQYMALGLAAENRRLAAPASLDGGVSSGLQEDFIVHPTPSALKLLTIIENAERIVGIELLAAADAYELSHPLGERTGRIAKVYAHIRQHLARYAEDQPMGDYLHKGAELVRAGGLETPFSEGA